MTASHEVVPGRPGTRRRIGVIGASLTGLVSAYELHRRGFQVTVFEKTDRSGGLLKTTQENGEPFENGPWAHVSLSPLVAELITRLNLHDQMVNWRSDATLPAILREGTIYPFPESALQYLTTGLWSVRGKYRFFRELFIKAQKPTLARDESVESFIARRFGHEAYEYGFEPLVRGRLAGSGTELSARATFPTLVDHEERFGSIIRGMVSGINTAPGKPFTFKNGLQELVDALTSALGESINFNTTVRAAIPMKAGHAPVYHVSVEQDAERETVEFDDVFFAANAHDTAEIIRPVDPGTASVLRNIRYAPIVNLYLAYDGLSIPEIPKGPGLLIPRSEHMSILSTEWLGNLATASSQAKTWGCTVLLGGMDSSDILSMSDPNIANLSARELNRTLGFPLHPAFSSINRIEMAVPQYATGYPDVIKSMERFEANFRGAHLCGSFRGGQALGAQIENGIRLAESLAGSKLN